MDTMEIITLITGVIYIILEIRQKSLMWVLGIATSIAAMAVFFKKGLYASFSLNAYYLVMSFIGLWQWSRDKEKISAGTSADTSEELKSELTENRTSGETPEMPTDAVIHLNRLPRTTVIISAILTVAGIIGMSRLMESLENPMSLVDSAVAVLSAVATWWLTRAYLEQWWIWILANTLSTVLCASQGLWWMTALYAAYIVSSVIGLIHWKKCGRYL